MFVYFTRGGRSIIAIRKIHSNRSSNQLKGFRSRYSQIGIDIGSARIKMIQLCHKRGRLCLHCKTISPTPAETFSNGLLVNPDGLSKELARLKEKYRWHKNRINLCLGPQAFYLRRVRLPKMKAKEISKAMFWEVEKHFPLPAADAVFDFCPADSFTAEEKQTSDYLLAAVAKDTADKYTAAAAKAGFFSASLDIQPLALFRSLKGSNTGQESRLPEKKALRVILDTGFKHSIILITGGNQYLYYRSIKTGIDHFCRALLQGGETDYRSAYRKLYEKSPLEGKNLLSAADMFASKIGQSIAYWADQSECPETALYSMEFCGGGAFIPGLASHIEKKLSLKRFLYNPLSPITGSSLNKQPEIYREETLFPAAYGLALRGWFK